MQQFPIVRQRDAIQCGVACLQMICQHYGKNITFEVLESMCVPTVEGVSLLGLTDAAKSLGFKALPMQMSLAFLKRQKYPCILHWDHKHFVVLYKYHNNKFFVADPGIGRMEYTEDDFIKHWSVNSQSDKAGIGLVMEPTDDFYSNMSCDSRKQGFSFSVLFKYLKQYKKHMFVVAGTLLIASILELILPFLTQSIVDIGIKNAAIKLIWLILLGEMMIVFGRTAIDFIRRWMLMHISIRLNLSLVSDFFIKLLRLPMTFFESKMVGDFLQRMEDHNRVQNFLTNQVLSLLFSGISFLILGSVLCFYNLLILGIFVLGSIIYGFWISLFLHKRKVIDYKLFGYYAQNHEKTFQFITNIQEIKLQGCERRRRWEWEDNQAELFTEQLKSLRLQQTQEAGSIFINEVKNILITVISATSVINGIMTLGEMLAVQYIIGQLNSPIEQLMAFINSYQDVRLSLERINEIHSVREEEETPEQLTHFPEEADKDLQLKNVYFKYNHHSRRFILEDINIIIPYGKITAIVGCSGSGKTTLLKLLLGFFPSLKGTISLCGKNINEYNPRWWRSHCGVVMQEGVIFSGSIARNIAVGDADIDYEKLEEAAKIAKIHDHIMNLPLKYSTLVGRNGMGLSQGQKQRILIARAVYKDPDYIFLDEATNALDAKNERDIVENLNEFYKGRTVIVVAHRLSTVKSADQIIVLDSGRVVETGNHNSLIDKKGAYYNLVKNQLELGR